MRLPAHPQKRLRGYKRRLCRLRSDYLHSFGFPLFVCRQMDDGLHYIIDLEHEMSSQMRVVEKYIHRHLER